MCQNEKKVEQKENNAEEVQIECARVRTYWDKREFLNV